MDKLIIAFFSFIVLIIVLMFVAVGFAIYSNSQSISKCQAVGGIYHNSVCYKVDGILKI